MQSEPSKVENVEPNPEGKTVPIVLAEIHLNSGRTFELALRADLGDRWNLDMSKPTWYIDIPRTKQQIAIRRDTVAVCDVRTSEIKLAPEKFEPENAKSRN